MIINHNMMANNAIRNMNINSGNASKSMQKLSSGLRINSAADDAAGLSISEKMRGQIRGLDQASSNAQDGISMIQTAEGALNETQSILQRMRELATQAGNDTNVTVDRDSIQKEMNQLSSEINRIGNTTEFNTQSLLKGDGSVSLDKTGKFLDKSLTGGTVTYTQAVQTVTVGTAQTTGFTTSVTLNGVKLTVNTVANSTTANDNTVASLLDASGNASTKDAVVANVNLTTAAATVNDNAAEVASGLQALINSNDSLRGMYTATASGAGITIQAVNGSDAKGSAGNMTALSEVSSGALVLTGGAASVGTDNYTGASATVTMGSYADVLDKGITIANKSIAFYDGSKGAYTGDADYSVDIAGVSTTAGVVNALASQIGNKISGVTLSNDGSNNLQVTADAQLGTKGNDVAIQDGGIQQQFKATFQVGANKGQQFAIEINDMRSLALAVTGKAGATASVAGATFTSSNTVTDGTSSTLKEAALDVSDATKATAAIKVVNSAIESVSAERSKLGAYQNRLEHTINNLGTSSENLTSAESRIRDVDMAKEMSTFSKNNILSQAAQAMLAQANQQPQQVLQLLR